MNEPDPPREVATADGAPADLTVPASPALASAATHDHGAGAAIPHGEHASQAAHGPGMPKGAFGAGAVALGALGVVFGDIGTSPLYAFREAFQHQNITVDRINALGVASCAFWALIIIISIKYLTLVMRADNKGEGGILALTALVLARGSLGRRSRLLVMLGVFGTALLYGDGLITPAISVLSAVEGLEIATPAFADWVIPITVVILLVLFTVQRRGTGAVGRVFGPVMVVWFGVLGLLGLSQIVGEMSVLAAINPYHIVQYFQHTPLKAFLSLGSIFLVVTGGEALYADMGHFGRRPIAIAWYSVVLPGLVLNYFGQAALLIKEPAAIESPFYRMAPDWAITPLAVLATMASVIASQALISGVFSLTVQAVQLDYLPRIAIRHTSREHQGQVYVPLVNWGLAIGSIGLVIAFRTSGNLAAAYGIAVTLDMVITTTILAAIMRTRWRWSAAATTATILPILVIDSMFLAGNIPKIPAGGWFPLLVAFSLLAQMATWRKGRQLVAARIHRGERPVADVLDEMADVKRVPGTAVFLFKDTGRAPPAMVNNLRHNKVLHKSTLIVSVHTADEPRVDPPQRAEVTRVEPGVHQVLLRFGFMEEPDVPAALARLNDLSIVGLHVDEEDITYFIGRESIVAGKVPGMHPLREQLFVLLNRGADSASRFFNLPPDRVFEVGSRVEI